MRSTALPRLESAGQDGWLIRLFDAIDEANMAWLLALMRDCETALGDSLVDMVPSYTTLLVVFDPERIAPADVRRQLWQVLSALRPDHQQADAPVRELLTWYDSSVGPELDALAEQAGMTRDEVVECHAGTTYQVYALGFAPGFAFMGSVDERLVMPRLSTPRKRVPAGSVGVAGQQTAAYPVASPGGWNLIGRTAAVLFDRRREGFSLLQVGDRVRFVPVTQTRFERSGGDITPVREA